MTAQDHLIAARRAAQEAYRQLVRMHHGLTSEPMLQSTFTVQAHLSDVMRELDKAIELAEQSVVVTVLPGDEAADAIVSGLANSREV